MLFLWIKGMHMQGKKDALLNNRILRGQVQLT